MQPIVPELYSSFPSRVTAWWVTPLILRGYKKPLTEEDCWQLEISDRAFNVISRVQAHLDGLVFSYIVYDLNQRNILVHLVKQNQLPIRRVDF